MIGEALDGAKAELNARPLVAIDIILEEISAVKPIGTSDNCSEYLTIFSQAILRSQELSEELWSEDSIDEIFDRELSQHVRRFIGICLLRLLAVDNSCFSRQTEFGIQAFTLFDDVLSEDIYPLFGVDKREQTYKKQSKLEDVVPSIESELSDIISSLSILEISSITRFRESFMQAIRNKKFKPILNPFLPKNLIDGRLFEVFSIVENYLKETGKGMPLAFKRAVGNLETYLSEVERFGTKYSREYLGAIVSKLLALLQEHFEGNPISMPANIAVSKGEKKYPFSIEGGSFNLGFTIRNAGPGYAFNVFLKVETTDNLVLEKSEFFLGDLPPTSIIEDPPIHTRVKLPSSSAYVIISLYWTNYDQSSGEAEFDFDLEGQPSTIDWKSLENKNPYSLEAVQTEDHLVGRTEILNQLATLVEAESIGSAYIFGQKRVGKTSIANALKSRLTRSNSEDRLALYIEGGDYITPDARTTIQGLGEILCDKIRESDKRFSRLEIPVFDNALAPLSRFLDSILHLAPDYKIIFILDEFDELPNELYRSEDVGRAFFLTIRSISGKPPFGFILVGGEKMEFILNYQGIVLNKFDSVRVDYFDKEKHLLDFRELVLKPLPKGIEVSEDALLSLYDQTAGNPFFTKLICRTLFNIMVQRRDSHVTRKEIEEATKLAARAERKERFQHFWLDGIFDTGNRAEATSIARRRVLVALAEIFRQHHKAKKHEIVEQAKKQGLSESEIEAVLMDFIRRQVLLVKEDTYQFELSNPSREYMYRCKVPFFGEWLKERGIQEIINTFADLDILLKNKQQEEEARISSDEIVNWVKNREITYRSHQLNEDLVRAWLNQFTDSEELYQLNSNEQQRLMFQILQHLTFYSRDQIRHKLKEAHGMVVRDLRDLDISWSKGEGKRKRSDILISYLDTPGKSGASYAKLYAEENDIYRGEGGNVVELGKLGQVIEQKQNLQALVFIDDFIGTGDSASEYFKKLSGEHGEMLRNSGLRIFFIALCGFVNGKSRIEQLLEELHLSVSVRICDPLDETARCFDDVSRIFPNSLDRDRARKIALHYGMKLEKKAPLGYGDCEATIVFEDSCPNNTLPILWAETNDWIPLFRRS